MLQRELSRDLDQTIIPMKGTLPDDADPGIFISTVGVFRSNGNFYWEQISPGICIHLIYGGAGVFEVDRELYRVKSGEVFVFWPGQRIRYWDFQDSPWRYTWMSIVGDELSWVYCAAGISRGKPHLNTHNFSELTECANEIVWTYKQGEYSLLYPCHAAVRLIDLLGSHVDKLKLSASEPLGITIKRLIDSYHLSVPSVDEISDQLNLNRATVYKAFHALHRMSVKEYIEVVRFEKACRLLVSSPANIKEVAFFCGYQDSRYFSRTFRKRFGMTPSDWRKRNIHITRV
jgi:AraC-like DNA-binding protein